jgi:hypothetical protein
MKSDGRLLYFEDTRCAPNCMQFVMAMYSTVLRNCLCSTCLKGRFEVKGVKNEMHNFAVNAYEDVWSVSLNSLLPHCCACNVLVNTFTANLGISVRSKQGLHTVRRFLHQFSTSTKPRKRFYVGLHQVLCTACTHVPLQLRRGQWIRTH